jgi:DNA-binding Xre family transcriptional regulator
LQKQNLYDRLITQAHYSLSEVRNMNVSYKKLWKILIDKEMLKTDLQREAKVSWGVIAKLSKGDTVNLESLIKICKTLNCTIDDIMDILPDPQENENTNGI